MRIQTTIEIEKDGVCLVQQDVTVSVDYTIRDGEVSWVVDQYIMEGVKFVGGKPEFVDCAAPEVLAKVFDAYLDKADIEEKLIERLLDDGELSLDESSVSLAADYHSRVL